MKFEKILSIPKSLWVSLHYFPLVDAIKLPIMVRYNTKLLRMRGKVVLLGGIKRNSLSVGFGSVGIFDKTYERTVWEVNGTIELHGKAVFGHGSRICVGKEGVLSIGNNFINTAAMTIVCFRRITIGDDVTTSWNTLVMDTDFHHLIDTKSGEVKPCTKEIIIGSGVWLCTRSVILKGTSLPNGVVVAACALVSGRFDDEDTIIAGNPARIKKYHHRLCTN